MKKKRILFLNGSADLYGASKAILYAIEGIDKDNIIATLLLPYRESLDKAAANVGAEVLIGPVAVMRRQNFSPAGILKFARDLVQSIRFIRKLDKEYPIDMIYTMTGAVISGAIYSRLFGKKHLWHIQEIITRPALLKRFIPFMVKNMSTICVANSMATGKYLSGTEKSLRPKVVYNGVPEPAYRNGHVPGSLPSGSFTIGMLGRLNWLKGQEVLIRAAREVIDRGFDVNVIIVGSYFGDQKFYLDNLKKLISELALDGKVKLFDFSENIKAFYEAMDVVVVPTTQPEAFGLVAAEAMALKKAVIASRIGGLPELVIDGDTGVLFKAGDDKDLAGAVIRLINDKDMRRRMGEAGRRRYEELFTDAIYKKNINLIIEEMLG